MAVKSLSKAKAVASPRRTVAEQAKIPARRAPKPMRRANGRHYLDFMRDMHNSLKPEWYFEIGTQTGASLNLSSARSIAVDPEFLLAGEPNGDKPELHLFQQTSDDFFASKRLDALGVRIDLAFLDGMHLYEFLLRDFMNTERYMSEDGVILLHDCFPWNEAMAERDRSKAPTAAWTGDVWKVVDILKRFRPDLQIDLYDCAPTGLVAVSNLDTKNRVLDDAYESIIQEYDNRSDTQKTVSSFKAISATSSPWSPFVARPDKAKLSFAIQLPVPRPRGQLNWGDFHFGMGLAKALQRNGAEARVQTKQEWGTAKAEDEIDLVIRGREPYAPRPGHRLMYWLISQDGLRQQEELSAADHIFVAGQPGIAPLKELYGENVSLLLQAFDPDRMGLPENDAERAGFLFVGISRPWERPMISHALASDTEIEIRGSGWDGHAATKWVKGGRVYNKELPQLYGRAKAVLNDHTDVMRKNGIPSNRIFDALACGAAVVSDDVAWLPDDIAEFVEIARTPDEFALALVQIEAEEPSKKSERRAFATAMRERHSFDQRAAEILEVAASLGEAKL